MGGIMTRCLAFLTTILVACTMVLSSSAAYSDNILSGKILAAPIIEGKEAAGIKLGDSEAVLNKVMGNSPLHVERHSESEKTISYGNMTDEGGVGINVFIKNGVVIGIEVMSRPLLSRGHLYKGKTKKDILFGDSLARITALYGKAYKTFKNKIFWYKKEGIIFECMGWDDGTGGNSVPNAVVIINPGSDIIPHLRKRGGYE